MDVGRSVIALVIWDHYVFIFWFSDEHSNSHCIYLMAETEDVGLWGRQRKSLRSPEIKMSFNPIITQSLPTCLTISSNILHIIVFCSIQIFKTGLILGHLGGSVGEASNFGSGHDLSVGGFEPRVGLCADSSEPGACFGFCVSLSLSPPLSLPLPPSKINKH